MLPWSAFWDHNYFALMFPSLRPLLANNYLRGAVTGLGVVNICAGFADLAYLFAGRDRSGAAMGERPQHPAP